jgi:hypothetical protein
MARVNTLWVAGFTADTPVLMVDGKTKPISKIKEGDWVASFDPKTKALRPGKVTGTLSEVMNEILEVTIDDKSMIVASSQRFFTPKGEWKTAPDAEAVLGIDGKSKTISAKKAKGMAKIYDITVRGDHAFFADGIMVHNGGGGGSSKPKPPPDPVVTAGKVGKPLTITANGNVITVPASPGDAAQISVSNSGGVSTNYHSVPGVPALPVIPGPRPIAFPRPINTLAPYNSVVAASSTRDALCNDMTSSPGSVSQAKKLAWQNDLRTMRANISSAKKSDRGNGVTNWTGGYSTTPAGRTLIYDDTNRDIQDLEKFLSKNKNFSTKDLAFIKGKCSELEANLATLRTSLTNNGQPIFCGTPDPTPGRDYSNEPGYAYYVQIGTSNGYTYRPPNNMVGLAVVYYKHFDAGNGLFYYDMNSENAI